jgi:hypothetical protein
MIRELTVQDADKRIRCSNCRRLFKVPDLQTLDSAVHLLAGAARDVFVDEQGNVYG